MKTIDLRVGDRVSFTIGLLFIDSFLGVVVEDDEGQVEVQTRFKNEKPFCKTFFINRKKLKLI